MGVGVERQGMAGVKERYEFTVVNEAQDTACNFNARSHSCVAPVDIALHVRRSVRI